MRRAALASPSPLARPRLLVAGAALALLAGCATPIEQAGPDAEAASVHGYLSVDRAVDPSAEGSERERASATFVRTREGTDAQVVARLLGAIPTLPAAGQCSSMAGDDPSLALHALSPAELVQVGDVTLTSGGEQRPLLARAYPDVAHLLSGVVYTTPDVAGAIKPGRAAFHVAGTAEVAGFDVEVDVPEPPAEVTVNGLPLREARASSAGPSGAAVSIAWSLSSVQADDVIYVDASWEGAQGASLRKRCVAPAGRSELSLEPLSSGALLLSVHRLRTVRFEAGPLSTTEVRLDTAVAGRVGFGQPG